MYNIYILYILYILVYTHSIVTPYHTPIVRFQSAFQTNFQYMNNKNKREPSKITISHRVLGINRTI